MIRFVSTVTFITLVAACGGTALPPARMADTQASISAATAVGSENIPKAALHLKMARDQFQQAQALNQDGKGEEAGLVVERARADAELALIITREAQASSTLQKAQGEVQGLENKNLR